MYHMYIMDSWMHKETKPTAIKKQTRERETKIDDYSRARKKQFFLMESERKT